MTRDYSEDLKGMIKLMLTKDDSKRPNIGEIIRSEYLMSFAAQELSKSPLTSLSDPTQEENKGASKTLQKEEKEEKVKEILHKKEEIKLSPTEIMKLKKAKKSDERIKFLNEYTKQTYEDKEKCNQ